jgi:hypothetical protein
MIESHMFFAASAAESLEIASRLQIQSNGVY